MIPINYKKGELLDEETKSLIKDTHDSIVNGTDDALFIFVGRTNTGKSNLALLIGCTYNPDMAIEQAALSNERFTEALQHNTNLPIAQRILHFDELDLSKRDGMTKWNKKMLKLYGKIRGMRILHMWCHPSLQMIDKPFIEERVNAVFFCYEKVTDRPRRFYVFSQKAIIRMMDKHKRLSLDVLEKYAKDYATYEGCFRRYDGPLLKPYMDSKQEGMNDAINSFVAEFGKKKVSRNKAAKVLEVGGNILVSAEEYGFQSGLLKKEKIVSPTGIHLYDEKDIETLRYILVNDLHKQVKKVKSHGG